MAFFGAIPISRKLSAVTVILCRTASLSIALVSYVDFKRNIFLQTQDRFGVLTESRANALIKLLKRL
jgi:hypothetical protein